jgi:hypothetical protein
MVLTLAVAVPASVLAVTSAIPATGLPSATEYSASVLPELAGVVSWKTLAQVEPVKQGGKMVPAFSKDVQGLDKTTVRVQGFIIPLDIGDKQKHFLISAVPPHCQFCMPAGPDAIVEVVARTPVRYGFDPIVVGGKFAVLKDDAAGLLYRLTDAEVIDVPKPPAAAR